MAASTILLILLSATIHVGWNLLVKSSGDPRAFSAVKGMIIAVIGIVVLPTVPLASLPGDLWFYAVLSGLIHAVYVLALSSAYRTGDVSVVYPIARSSPAFVAMAAYLMFAESISIRGALGIGLVAACIVLLHSRQGESDSEARSRQLVGVRWALLTLASVVAYSLVDKAAMVVFAQVDAVKPLLRGPVYFLIESVISFSLYALYIFWKSASSIRALGKDQLPKTILAAVGTLVSYSLILHVMQTEKVSYVVTLRQSSMLIAVLVGWLWLKEARGVFRLIVAAVMLLALSLVVTAE